MLVGVALLLGGLLLTLYALPPVSPIAFFALIVGLAFTLGGVWLMVEGRRS